MINPDRLYERIAAVEAEHIRLTKQQDDDEKNGREPNADVEQRILVLDATRRALEFASGMGEPKGQVWQVWHEGVRLFNLADPTDGAPYWQIEDASRVSGSGWRRVKAKGLTHPLRSEVAMWFVAMHLAKPDEADHLRGPCNPESVFIVSLDGTEVFYGDGSPAVPDDFVRPCS